MKVDALVSGYGYLVMAHGDDTALEQLANTINGSNLDRTEMAALAAFAVRRLFNKKSDLVKSSVN